MSGIDVIGFGALNMDLIYSVKRIVSDGEIIVDRFTSSPGGSAANTIYGLAKLGVSTGFVGAVGDDEEGRMLVEDFNHVGVDSRQIRSKKAKTGVALCLTDKAGKRAIHLLPGASSLLEVGDIDLGYISQAKILHLSSFADERQLELQKQLMSQIPSSVKISFAPGSIYASKGLEALTAIIERSHALFLNRKEVEKLTAESFQKGAKKCLDQGCQIVVVTLGKGITKGKTTATCYLASSEGEHIIESQKADTRPEGDTIGAGDAFACGFLYGLLREKDFKQCGYLGDLVARFSITKSGARAGLPTIAELRKRYRQLYGKTL
jgi:ribokinase